MKVLIIEDNKTDFINVREMIDSFPEIKCHIDWATSVAQAKQILTESRFDVVLLDLTLPDAEGITAFEQIHKFVPQVPIIIFSDIENEDIPILAVRKGAQDYLSKNNFDRNVLVRAIRYSIERKQSEEALRDSEEKFRIIFDESLDVIVIIDCYTGLIYNVNPSALHYLGYRTRDLVGKHYSTLFPVQRFFAKDDFLSKVIINGSVIESQEFLRADGSKIPMDITATLIPWGKTKAILASLRDATERRKVEDAINQLNRDLEKRVFDRTSQLEAALAELQMEVSIRKAAEEKMLLAKNEIAKALEREKELNELKSRFISMVSHEYRTPLAVISSSAELLDAYNKQSSPEKFTNHVKKILDSVEFMTELLENVLTVEKLDSDSSKIVHERIDLIKFIRDIVDTHREADQNAHKIIFTYNNDNSLFLTDRSQIKSIIDNLLSNSLKYSEEGKNVVLNLDWSGQGLVIAVHDNGIGISNEEMQSLFEPFQRGENVGITKGFGIGLYIAKKSAQALGGNIELESDLYNGTTFKVFLPYICDT